MVSLLQCSCRRARDGALLNAGRGMLVSQQSGSAGNGGKQGYIHTLSFVAASLSVPKLRLPHISCLYLHLRAYPNPPLWPKKDGDLEQCCVEDFTRPCFSQTRCQTGTMACLRPLRSAGQTVRKYSKSQWRVRRHYVLLYLLPQI